MSGSCREAWQWSPASIRFCHDSRHDPFEMREKIWSAADLNAAARQFHHDDVGGFWTWLPIEPAVVDGAAKIFLTLPPTVYLRAADCLHLVTALHHNFSDVHTHDKHQIAAAAALGLNPIAIT